MQPCKGITSGTSLDPRATKGTPEATGGRRSQTSRSPPGRRRAVTPQNADGGQHPEWVPPLARTEAPSRPFAPRRSQGSPHTSRMQGGTPEQRQATKNPSRSGRRSWRPPPAARRVVFREDTDRGLEVPTTAAPNEHHLPPIPDASPRGPHRTSTQPHLSHTTRARATGSASHGPPPGGRWSVQLVRHLSPRVGGRPATGGTARHGHTAKGTRGRPTVCRMGGEDNPPNIPPLQAGCDDTGPEREHRPPNQLGLYTRGFLTPAATRQNRRGAGVAPQQREHDRSGAGADAEMTGTSGPKDSGDSLPTAEACSMPQQQEPSMGNVPRGLPGTAQGQPSPTGATPDQDREAVPPPLPPTTTTEELRALYGIHTTALSTRSSASPPRTPPERRPEQALRRSPPDTRRNNRSPTSGTQITDDLVDAWIWWFNTHQPDHGGIWVPQLGWAHTLIAPSTNPSPRQAPGAGTDCPASRSRDSPHPTVRRPGGVGKQDGPR